MNRLTLKRAASALFCAALAVLASTTSAQEARPMRIVVPAPPGGNLDVTARLIAQWMTTQSAEPWIVENRPGGNTVIGIDYVVRAPADGRTLLYHATAIVTTSLLQKTSYSPLEDLAPVLQVSTERYALVVPPSSPAESARGLEQLAASRAQGINCASTPGVSVLACAQFNERMRGRSTTIPYVGVAPAVQAMVGGHADLLFVNFESVSKLVETGRLRELAVSSRQGLKPPHSLVPLITEIWPDFVMEGFSGFLVPAATPAARIQELNRDLNRALADPALRAAMVEAGQDPVGGAPERFTATMRRVNQHYGAVINRLDLGPR